MTDATVYFLIGGFNCWVIMEIILMKKKTFKKYFKKILKKKFKKNIQKYNSQNVSKHY
jgi:predicted RNA-binding protein YlxR (DUF448 family)